jgi:hypothetical protein
VGQDQKTGEGNRAGKNGFTDSIRKVAPKAQAGILAQRTNLGLSSSFVFFQPVDIPGMCLASQPSRDQPGRDSISTVNPDGGALLEGWSRAFSLGNKGRAVDVNALKAENLKRWQACQPIPSLVPIAKRKISGECSLWLAESLV